MILMAGAAQRLLAPLRLFRLFFWRSFPSASGDFFIGLDQCRQDATKGALSPHDRPF